MLRPLNVTREILHNTHYNDVIMSTTASQTADVSISQPFVQAHIK